MKRWWIILGLCLMAGGIQAASPTRTLPIIYVNTLNAQAVNDRETQITASLYIDSVIADYPSLGSEARPVPCTIKGRGNWTWNGFDKKPYKIKLDTKQKILGMPNNRHWCLLPCADDYLGFLKMPAGLFISKAVGLRWTPRQRPVELVLNGQYKGLYFLTEHVRIASNRVKITEQKENESHADSITGGWLIEIDNYRSENNIEFKEGNGQHVMISLREPEVLSAQQRTYIEAQIQGLNDALYGSSAARLEQLLDIHEAAKFYLVQEIMEDCESYHGSCFLYKDRDSLGVADKWKFGPVWDFGNAYNRHQEEWIYTNATFEQFWIGQLSTWPAFQQAVQEEWWLFYRQKDSVRTNIRSYADRIKQAAVRDADVWRNTSNYCDNSNYTDVRDRFFRRYDWRIQWLYSQWGEGIQPLTWGIGNPDTEHQATKRIVNGQILIERNGVLYTLSGTKVQHNDL